MKNLQAFVAYQPEDFLDIFFAPVPKRGMSRASDYFRSTFEPLPGSDFSEWLTWLTPSHEPRFLTVEGQSRVGKTWTIVGAIRELLRNGSVNTVFTTGEDSFQVFGDVGLRPRVRTGSNLYTLEGFESLYEALDSARKRGALLGRVLVLLDDFLGISRLRHLARDERQASEVAKFLSQSMTENPLLRDFSDISPTYVVTARSAVMVAAKIRLGLSLTENSAATKQLGFFETVEGLVFGSRDQAWLETVHSRHKKFIKSNKDFLFPYFLAFASPPPQEITEDYENTAKALFSGDLAEFSDEISLALSQMEEGNKELPHVLTHLDEIYLLYVAPGLMFPTTSADTLFFAREHARFLRKVLYLVPEALGEVALRVPNRYYLKALSTHLSTPGEISILIGVLKRSFERKADTKLQRNVLVRGLLERTLLARQKSVTTSFEDDALKHTEEEFSELYNSIAELIPIRHPLLDFELALLRPGEVKRFPSTIDLSLSPGLASAVGWAVYTFKNICEEKGCSILLSRLVREFQGDIIKRMQSADSEEVTTLAASFSNMLRWIAQIDPNPEPSGYLDVLSGACRDSESEGSSTTDWKRSLAMVLEDALIWADSFQLDEAERINISLLPAAISFSRLLSKELEAPEEALDDWTLVNRLFSVAWHNEWQERREGVLTNLLRRWLKCFGKSALLKAAASPQLLDDNLQYHWHHMIAQWAVWTRDWCFSSDDPIAYERDRAPEGCIVELTHNTWIAKLLAAILDSINAENLSRPARREINYSIFRRVRNATFLLGARSGGLEEEDAKLFDDSVRRLQDISDPTIGQALLNATFELSRQGYLEAYPFGARTTSADRRHFMPEPTRGLFKKIHANFRNLHDHAWSLYEKEIKNVTCLDIIPRDWDDIKPADWTS
jgi:hypothetical protein